MRIKHANLPRHSAEIQPPPGPEAVRTAVKPWGCDAADCGLARKGFADNAIDLSVIRDLTEQDLKDLGVLLGHRRKILRAIAELDWVTPAPIKKATEPMLRNEAERRHLTVMICDLVGSTALSGRSIRRICGR